MNTNIGSKYGVPTTKQRGQLRLSKLACFWWFVVYSISVFTEPLADETGCLSLGEAPVPSNLFSPQSSCPYGTIGMLTPYDRCVKKTVTRIAS